MDFHMLALRLMAFQGVLGAFDTLYHHELSEALPQHASARRELRIHALRAVIYSVLFIGLAAWQWHGVWAILLLLLLGIEIVLTLWDFVVEDQTRLLPASERVTHTILAINGGAFITLLLLNTPDWLAQPSAMQADVHGALSVFLVLCGVGVGLSGVRDAFAASRLARQEACDQSMQAIHFSDKKETVLVTGATGFIGQLLVRALLMDGQQVIILTRRAKLAAWTFEGRVRCIQSMSDLPDTQRLDVIINLAGARILGWRWTEKRKAELRSSRIGLTQGVVAWIAHAQHKPRLLLSASAIGYYGIQAHGENSRLSEDSPPQSIFMSQLCQEWEAVAQSAAIHGVRVRCMRFGLVLGQQGALAMMLLPIRLGLGGALGSGEQWLSWIHVQDVLRGIAHLWQTSGMTLSDSEKFAAYNFTAPQTLSQIAFSQIAAGVLHRPCFLPTPAFPIRLMLGEQADLLLEGQRVVPTRLLHEGFMFRYPELKAALENLV